MRDKFYADKSFDNKRAPEPQIDADYSYLDEDQTSSSSEKHRRRRFPWEEESQVKADNSLVGEYESDDSETFEVPSFDLYDEPIIRTKRNVKRRKTNRTSFKTPVVGYAAAFCFVAAVGAMAFLSFSKLRVNASGDLETIAKLRAGSCVRCDNVVVGLVKDVDMQTGTAKLELERDSRLPIDSQFVFSSKKYGEHIEVIRGVNAKTLQSGATVSLASELDYAAIDPALIREKLDQGVQKIVSTSEKVGKATGLDPKFVLCCFIFLICLVSAYIFRRIKAAASLACFGTFLSALWLVVRWTPEIAALVTTITEAFQ